MSRLDPLLTDALEALTRCAIADDAERKRFQRLAEGTRSPEAADAARTRATAATERARADADAHPEPGDPAGIDAELRYQDAQRERQRLWTRWAATR